MNRPMQLSRILLLCVLMAFMLTVTPIALAEEEPETTADTNDFTGTYEIGGQTGSGKKFSAVIVVWDAGETAAVRGVVPKVGPITKSFQVEQTGEGEYLVSGGVYLYVISGSGSATITKKGEGYEIGGSASGEAFGNEGSVSFGGARTSTSTDSEVSTTIEDKKDAASGEKPMAGADSAAQPLTPDSDGEIPPVQDTTKAGLIGLISLLIAIQIILEVITGGGISKERIGELLTAGSAAASGSSTADAAGSAGDIGSSASQGGDE